MKINGPTNQGMVLTASFLYLNYAASSTLSLCLIKSQVLFIISFINYN